ARAGCRAQPGGRPRSGAAAWLALLPTVLWAFLVRHLASNGYVRLKEPIRWMLPEQAAKPIPEEVLHTAPGFLTQESVTIGVRLVVFDQSIDRNTLRQDPLQIEHLPVKILIFPGPRTDETGLQSAHGEADAIVLAAFLERRGHTESRKNGDQLLLVSDHRLPVCHHPIGRCQHQVGELKNNAFRRRRGKGSYLPFRHIKRE